MILFCRLPLFQGKGEGSTAFRNAFYMDLLFVRFDDVFDDGESQSCSTLHPGTTLIDPVESFENATQILFFDAYTIVIDLNQQEVVHIVKAYINVSVPSPVFDGIPDQVTQRFEDPLLVCLNQEGYAGSKVKMHCYASFGCFPQFQFEHLFNQFADIENLGI